MKGEEGRRCKHCNTPLSSELKNNAKYCNAKCRTRYNSLERYYKIKDSPEYKKQKKEYFAKWLDKNRERFNAAMRPLSRNYQRRKQVERNEANKLHDEKIRQEASVVATGGDEW